MKKKKVLLWSGIVIVIVITAGVVLISTYNHVEGNYIDGRLLSYEKNDESYSDFILYTNPETFKELDGPYYFDMDIDTMDDLFKYPEKYMSYWINIEITNTSNKNIYDIKAALVNKYKNLWLDTASLSESPLNLEANKTYKLKVFVIIKREAMSDKEIDELVKNIKIKIYTSDLNVVIGFDD